MTDLVARVPRLPVPGETIFARSFEQFVGGKGVNQAIAAARLGAPAVTMIGCVGQDAFGDRILAALAEAGVDPRFISRDPEERTGVAIPLVFDDGGNSIVSAPGANLRLTAAAVATAEEAIRGAGVLLLQFEVAMEANVAAVAMARRAGIPVILNTAPVAPFPPELLALATCVVANEVEAAALAPGSPRSPEEQARAFLLHDVELAVVTLGDQGLVFATNAGVERVPAFPVQAVDSVGAGDAFCGALAVALLGGRPPADSCRFASAAGAICATRPGAAASLPSRAEVDALLASP
jgi:ribokinase